MLLACLVCLFRFSRNVPLTEDWELVPPLTGNQPHLVSWLWAQNNEHRIPFPRLILLALLRLAHGDFRVGMGLNIVLLAVLAAALMLLARKIRGGQTRYADAFFPVGLLHLGNWENLFWSWQVTQVVPMALTCVVLYLLLANPGFTTVAAAVAAGASLILLPLSGANGLFFAPFFACWLGYCGWRQWRSDAPAEGRQRRAGVSLLACSGVALALTGLYFAGYVRPQWTPPNPGVRASLVAAIQFVALAFGPAARSSWVLAALAAAAVLVPSAIVAARGFSRAAGPERHRALGVLVLAGTLVLFGLVMGWGRAGVIPIYGFWPIRYSLLAFPALITAFFVWELYGAPRPRAVIQNALFTGMFLLMPLNTVHGFWWRDWYLAGFDALQHDLAAGVPRSALADRNRGFLSHSMDPPRLAALMLMLKDSRMGPWVQLRGDPPIPDSTRTAAAPAPPRLVTQEFRLLDPGAGEVSLVWGIGGWQTVAEDLRPPETVIENKVMHTEMARTGDGFVATVRVPAGARIDYGFLTTRAAGGSALSVWDGDYAVTPSGSGLVERRARLSTAEGSAPRTGSVVLVTERIHYRMPAAGKVLFVWGVDDWNPVPEVIRPAGTALRNGVMATPMTRSGDTFAAEVRLPAGATMSYGFLITRRRGVLSLVRAVWDGRDDYRKVVAGDGVFQATASVTLPNEWADIRAGWRYWSAGLASLVGAWLLLLAVQEFFYAVTGRAAHSPPP